MKHYGENLKYYKCCKQDDKRFTLIPGVKGCTSQMHNFEVTENLKNIYKWKHFCVETFLKEGEKDIIIETMNE